MAISIDHTTRTIFVPKTDLTPLGGALYMLDVNDFRLWLKDWEDSEEGIDMPDTHKHNTEVVLGGVTLARVVEIINGYNITFEDGQYAINLGGANNNLADVTNVNSVSIRSNNSAGLTAANDPAELTETLLGGIVEGDLSLRESWRLALAVLLGKVSGAETNHPVFRNPSDTKNRVTAITDEYGNRSSVTIDASD